MLRNRIYTNIRYGDPATQFIADSIRLPEAQRTIGGFGAVSEGFQAWRVVRMAGRRRVVVRPPWCGAAEITIPVGGNRAFYGGQRISVGVTLEGAVALTDPPDGLLNQSRFPYDATFGSLVQPKIESVDGEPYPGAVAFPITVHGVNFLTGDLLTALVWSDGDTMTPPGYIVDPLVTVHTEANVDDETMTAEVDVDAAKLPGLWVTLRIERG